MSPNKQPTPDKVMQHMKQCSATLHECDRCSITRKRSGRGFSYFDIAGHRISDNVKIKQIKSLTIPPMWTQVRISECRFSKVQAFGYDQRSRKQYIYHEKWHKQRQQEKFEKLPILAELVPKIRLNCKENLQKPNWSKRKICSLVVIILSQTGMRIGNKQYRDMNDTFGLTTLRRKHLDEQEDQLFFDFDGKHGKHRHVQIVDEEVKKLVCESATQPGYSLFRYKENSKWHDVISDDINTFLSELTCQEISAKDLRTWFGTRLSVE